VIKIYGGHRSKIKEVEDWEAIFVIWSLNSRIKTPYTRTL
jgi:hypothetical protein